MPVTHAFEMLFDIIAGSMDANMKFVGTKFADDDVACLRLTIQVAKAIGTFIVR